MPGLSEPPIKVGIAKDRIRVIAGQQRNLTFDQVKQIITQILEEILELTLIDMDIWIDAHVPKRTGQLRDNLHQNIRSSRVRTNIMRIIIRTSIDYAEQVNQMTDAQVRHTGTWREHSGKKAYAYYYGHYGPIFLDDPRAYGGFFDKLVEFTKERVLINMVKIKNKYMGGKLTSRQMAALEYTGD